MLLSQGSSRLLSESEMISWQQRRSVHLTSHLTLVSVFHEIKATWEIQINCQTETGVYIPKRLWRRTPIHNVGCWILQWPTPIGQSLILMSGFTEIWLEGSVAYYKPDLCLNMSLQMSVYTILDITPTAAIEHEQTQQDNAHTTKLMDMGILKKYRSVFWGKIPCADIQENNSGTTAAFIYRLA